MAGPALDRVLQKLKGVKPAGKGFKAQCPAHDDQIQSLHVTERPDLSVGLHCYAGCDKEVLLDAMGLTFTDLFASPMEHGKQIVNEYNYRDITGVVQYQAVRYFPKEFRQRRPDGAGKWIDGPGCMDCFKGKHIPYRLNELKGHTDVCIVEGEKDADRLWSLGIPATTNIGGAKNWTDSDSKWLKTAGVTRAFIIEDNDEAGHQRTGLVGQSVKALQIAVSVLELPEVGPHEDVSDWLDNGGSKEALQALMAAVPYVVPPQHVHVPPPPPVVLPDTLPDPLGYTIGSTLGAGAAEAFRDRYKDRLRYDHSREQWFIWDQHRWRIDNDELVMRLALEHSRRWGQEVTGAAPDFGTRKKWQDYTIKLERRPDRVTMLADARALPPFAGTPMWDADPWLLGVPNGVVDLKTGKLRDGLPTDWISQHVGPAYDPSATCPRWLKFLDEVFAGDTALIEYVQCAVGYSLTADMREQCFFLAHGGGSNGKSIFLNTLETLLGDYGQRATMRLFIGEASEFHMAELQGARMIFAAESKPDTRLNTDIIKSLTGGETQDAQRKHQHPFVFRPVGKIWLGVNHVPKVIDDSHGFWRRVRLVPFTQTFEGATDDRQLRDKLAVELPGILTWAVQGTAAWLEKGLVSPAAVTAATDEYQTSEDPLVEFIAERCKLDKDGIETFAALYAAYNGWADEQKIARRDRLSRRGFGIHLKRRFTTKDSQGTRRYGGVKITASDPNKLQYDDESDIFDGDDSDGDIIK